MTQPVIGISPTFDQGTKIPQSSATYYVRRSYTEVIKRIGAVPLLLNMDMPMDSIMELCDGIVISGGEDLNPSFYNQDVRSLPGTLLEPTVRTQWEYELIAACDVSGKSILGICYGMQLLNVYYGGTLCQDIFTERPHSIPHLNTQHEVEFTESFLGYKLFDKPLVASRHHQAVDELASNFEVCATASDGTIEAIRNTQHFGMQWHPESDETGIRVYKTFVDQCVSSKQVQAV